MIRRLSYLSLGILLLASARWAAVPSASRAFTRFVPSTPPQRAVADFDGDGRLDVALIQAVLGRTRVWVTLRGSPDAIGLDVNAVGVAVSDVDHDGDADLVVVTGTNFSVSSGVGFLALFGVSVQTGVIMLEYINQLRARGHTVIDAAVEGAILRLRPIMMTMLVATLGLLPAALSHDIGSDSQRPFAIVIVGGLIADLVMSIFLLPTLYAWMAGVGGRAPGPRGRV
jgi:hypothetical protein